eukprot:evm.model.scf_1429.2 EVM.evm.TU.scf_1429.2   scf_1429:6247-9696(-)
MAADQAFAVLGAGGPTGLECVKRLLELGHKVIAVVRNPDKHRDAMPKDDRVSLVQGDVTKRESLETALKGAKGVIFAAAGQSFFAARGVDNLGVENVAVVAAKIGVEPVVLVSSGLVSPKHRLNPIRMMINNMRWGLMDHKWRGEERLRKNGAVYVIVRPKRLVEDDGGPKTLIIEQGDNGQGGRISRASLAAVCCKALTDPGARNKTFEVHARAEEGASKLEEQLPNLFDNLQDGITQ